MKMTRRPAIYDITSAGIHLYAEEHGVGLSEAIAHCLMARLEVVRDMQVNHALGSACIMARQLAQHTAGGAYDERLDWFRDFLKDKLLRYYRGGYPPEKFRDAWRCLRYHRDIAAKQWTKRLKVLDARREREAIWTFRTTSTRDNDGDEADYADMLADCPEPLKDFVRLKISGLGVHEIRSRLGCSMKKVMTLKQLTMAWLNDEYDETSARRLLAVHTGGHGGGPRRMR